MADPASQPDKRAMVKMLLPMGAVALLVVVVAVLWTMSGAGVVMSDGSNGTANDPNLSVASDGVRYRDLREGTGNAVKQGDTVRVKYKGWLTDGSVFDAQEFMEFRLDQVIDGWAEGMLGMRMGGTRKLVVAPEKGYGTQVKTGIPSNSTLIFEITLISIAPPGKGGPASRTPRMVPDKLSDGTAPGDDDPKLIEVRPGLKYRDLKEGNGTRVPEGATITIDYTGWLMNGTSFDSSLPRSSPSTFALGGLIAGWQMGIPGMMPGGVRKLVIAPELGYGSIRKGDIPPGSTLVFEIELIESK